MGRVLKFMDLKVFGKTFCISFFKTTRQISPTENPLITYKKMSVLYF